MQTYQNSDRPRDTKRNLMQVLKIGMICATRVKIYTNRVKCLNCSSWFQVLCVKMKMIHTSFVRVVTVFRK